MSHGIMTRDRGYVNVDSTWHGLPQFECIPDRAISITEALGVARYPLEKFRLSRQKSMTDAEMEFVKAWAIVRTDYNITLVPAVGERFTLLNNDYMVNFISEHLLAIYPDLEIESVGTLFNGATFFLNLRVKKFTVRTDESVTITNMLFCNPLGNGSYRSCVHNTRVVCANTERIAETQGIANQSIKKFHHTMSSAQKINDHLVDLAELKLALKKHEDTLNELAITEVNKAQIDAFLNKMFPTSKTSRGNSMQDKMCCDFLDIFEGVQKDTLAKPFTKYGLYCAYTDLVDHKRHTKRSDAAASRFDGIIGARANKKIDALNYLVSA